jgi:hypothetical protein
MKALAVMIRRAVKRYNRLALRMEGVEFTK